jgi:hypothetical protein
MLARVLTLPFRPETGGVDDSALVALLAHATGASLRERLMWVDGRPYVICVVTYHAERAPAAAPMSGDSSAAAVETTAALPPEAARRLRQDGDPFVGMSADDRRVGDALRQWRSQRARKDGVPPYLVLTNRELVRVAHNRPPSFAALQALDGIGPGRVERYGQGILEVLLRCGAGAATSAAAPMPEAPPTAAAAGAAGSAS